MADRRSPSSRLFLALWPDEGTRDAIAAWQSQWQWPQGARLVGREQLHLTLHFIGNVPVTRIAELRRGLRAVFEPMELAFGSAQLWPGGIAVLRPTQVPASLLALHARLAQALQRLGLPVEDRAYRAHVTLARKAAGATAPPEASLRWAVDSGYVLVQSLANGGRYEVLERFSPP